MTNQPYWHLPTAPSYPSLDGDLEADVCVIGLGASGLAAALEAAALGATVVGIDRSEVAAGAAGRNGGLLLGGLAEFHHDAADRWGPARASALYRMTLDEMRAIRRDYAAVTWWNGSLRIADDEMELEDCARQQSRMALDGLPVEWYEGPEGRGLLFPEDGGFHPARRAHQMAERAVASGVRLYTGTPALAIDAAGVETPSGRVRASQVVICADGALGTLLPELARRVRPVRLQMLATAPAHDVRVPRPVYARHGYDYWQQLADGSIALGGGRDQFREQEFTTDSTPTEPLQAWLDARLRTAVGTAAPVTHRWAAVVSYTDDALPIAEMVRPGVHAAGAYNGTGNVVGVLCGRGLARRALGHADPWLDLLDSIRSETS
ncbi:MAG: FAD-dependent oxidoreductase [Gemmatimonadaceae bacterium]|nr:FAD-dependent oxidoreductase [Gemmatimonadaceae bacterium]